jgi:tetratricopeptide (TPR) repeat protein
MIDSIQRVTLAWVPTVTALAAATLLLSGCAVGRAIDEERSEFTSEKGFSLLKEQDYEGAKPYFVRALELDPRNQEARINLGLCYQKLGRPADARTEYLKVIEYEQNDKDPMALYTNEGVKTTATVIASWDLRSLDENTRIVPLIPASSQPSAPTGTHD